MPLPTKTYIVALKKDVDYDTFWAEMEDPTSGLPHIPDRAVGIVNDRVMFKRICEYALTDSEADRVRNDPRVAGVEIPFRDNPAVNISTSSTQNTNAYSGNFNKQAGNWTTGTPPNYSGAAANSINWGLIAHSYNSNQYGANPAGTTGLTTTSNYNYALDGTNVDIIINDGGIQKDHPELVGRVVEVNWDSIAATLSIPVTGWNDASYNPTDGGHGTHVAGIAAGKTYGWAKNANIISLYYANYGVSTIDPLDTFSMMLYWHQTKSINPATGVKNPTVVNMSWGFDILRGISGTEYYTYITGGKYRNEAAWTGSQSESFYQNRALVPLNGNGLPIEGALPGLPYSSDAYNVALDELIAAGIIVCRSAGNSGFKVDNPLANGGSGDYDNYIVAPAAGSGNFYYNRGDSPNSVDAIRVGALDTLTSSDGLNQRIPISCAGPGVDIWAAGTFIMSSWCNGTEGAPYFRNQVGQSFREANETGTSMASPQVAGICALYLQANPTATPAQVKSWLVNNATTGTFYSPGNATSYTNYTSLLGGNALVAYNPYNSANNVTITGGITLTNIQLVNN